MKITEIKNSTCDYKKLEGDDNDVINLFKNFKNIQCFHIKPYNLSIIGSENKPANPQGSLHFYLNMCTNSTEKTNCLPKEEIKIKMGEIKVSVNFPNKEIDKDLNNPFIDFTDGKILRFSSTLMTKYTFEVDALEFYSNDGFYF